MNTSKYPIRQSRRSLSAPTTIWSSFCKVLGTFCEWQLILPNLKTSLDVAVYIYIYMHTWIHTCMVGRSALQIMSPGMKQLNSVALHTFCIFVQQLSAWAITQKLSHPIILVKVLPYCGLSYSPLNYVVQSPCQCGNRQWAMRNRPFSQSMKLIGYPPVNELYIYNIYIYIL